jgi:Protein of unknown function (DUF1524)
VYNKLHEKWHSIDDPEIIISELSKYQNAFLDLTTGSNLESHPKSIHEAFRRLHEFEAPSSTLPFLMQLSNALKFGTVCEQDGSGILGLIESFLVRRAVCGHEPTGLHAVFKRLWADCDGAPTPQKVEAAIRKHRTVAWPGKQEFSDAVMSRELYGASITRFALSEWNRSLGGDKPGDSLWIEHVLPENPCDEWFKIFTPEEHKTMVHRLGNLLPLSEEMNRALGNSSYDKKRPIYQDDSGYKAARKFAEKYSQWTPSDLNGRSAILAEWAISRWPH